MQNVCVGGAHIQILQYFDHSHLKEHLKWLICLEQPIDPNIFFSEVNLNTFLQ